jgi:hypothetical protein
LQDLGVTGLQEVKAGLHEDLDASVLEWLTARILDALSRGEPVGPTALTFLLGRYAATNREDVSEALGQALAAALEEVPSASELVEQTAWTLLFAHAAHVSDDTRVRDAARSGVEQLRVLCASHVGSHDVTNISAHLRAVEACLTAAQVVESPTLLGDAVNELEQVVAARYEPGRGMGTLEDEIATASALLTAYALTGRVPYSMLADELVQIALRTPWVSKPFEFNCEAALVCVRLAELHRDADYRLAAVTSTNGDYGREAARVLSDQLPQVWDLGTAAAPFGVALAQWLNLQ